MTTTLGTAYVLSREGEARPLGVYQTHAAALKALNNRNGLMRIDDYEVQG